MRGQTCLKLKIWPKSATLTNKANSFKVEHDFVLLEFSVCCSCNIDANGTGGEGACTWEYILDIPGQHPVDEGIDKHHDDGNHETVTLVLLRALTDVAPLNAHALLLVAGEVLTAKTEGHTGQKALVGQQRMFSWTPRRVISNQTFTDTVCSRRLGKSTQSTGCLKGWYWQY